MELSNTVERIKALHKEFEDLGKKTLTKGIEIGGILTAEKERLGHGNWGVFLEKLPFTDRTARRYMKLYERRESIAGLGGIAEAYKALGSGEGKTDTVSDLDPVVKALEDLEQRAWNLQFSQIAWIQLIWNGEKYEFTKWLKECWQDWPKVSGYLKNHLQEQLTVRSEKRMDNIPFSQWCWIEAFCHSLLATGSDFDERTYQKDKADFEATLKEIEAPQELWDKFNRLNTEIAFDNLTFAELAWNYCHNAKVKALNQDIEHLDTVYRAFMERLTGESLTIAEAKRRANKATQKNILVQTEN